MIQGMVSSAKILTLGLLLILAYTQAPDQFSWDSVNGTSFITPASNQNFPSPCNSGWAFSAIDVLNSRIKRLRNAASPDIQLSTQVLLSCDEYNYGCMSGQPISAFRWIKRYNITDSSCNTYLAKGYTNGVGCTSQIKCQSCIDGTCKGMPNSKIYTVHDYGYVAGEKDMMNQIYKYGPISCGVNSSGLNGYTTGILKNGQALNRHDHYVFVYGWGLENGTKFWKVKNSWGSNWGENGTFRIQKGKNTLGIQSSCAWASPHDTWTEDIRNKTAPNSILQKVKSLSYALPAHLTASRSSITPHHCDSSWAFSVVQMIADRESKNTNGKRNIKLSVQNLLNCGVGKCSKGGSPIDALIFIQKYGLAEESCQNYQGVDPEKQVCSGVSNCGVCQGSVFDYKCTEVKSYKRWKISNYGFFAGAQNMKNQIYEGPIVCGMHASEEFKNYRGGIFSQKSVTPKIDHYVELVGYGSESGKNYWIGRNSWGTAWGESSFFRIQMGSDNLGIETKCYFSKGLV